MCHVCNIVVEDIQYHLSLNIVIVCLARKLNTLCNLNLAFCILLGALEKQLPNF